MSHVGVQSIRLRCRDCGAAAAIELFPRGCPACAGAGRVGLLEAVRVDDEAARRALGRGLESRERSIWRFADLLPLPPDSESVSLGEGSTPLIPAPWLEHLTGARGVYLKNETANPTWAAKDRANAVSASVARAFGAPGMVAITTGNHGASAAAYAARAGLRSIILCSPQSDVVHRAMIAAYGGDVVVTADPEPLLRHLVHEHGWFAATSIGEASAPNPFGVEGYKTTAYEIFADLGGVPDAMLVPASSGDLLYGIYKGFRELRDLGLVDRCPRMIGCQAAGAAPLTIAYRDKLETVPVLPSPSTLALSIGDASGGAPALGAARETGGGFIAVPDAAIVRTQQELASRGLLVELASAATVAALAVGVADGTIAGNDRIVCLLTGAAVKWSAQLISSTMRSVTLEPALGALDQLVDRPTHDAHH